MTEPDLNQKVTYGDLLAMRCDGTMLGNTTLETIRALLDGGYIEEQVSKPAGLIYYTPTLKGWMVLEAARGKK